MAALIKKIPTDNDAYPFLAPDGKTWVNNKSQAQAYNTKNTPKTAAKPAAKTATVSDERKTGTGGRVSNDSNTLAGGDYGKDVAVKLPDGKTVEVRADFAKDFGITDAKSLNKAVAQGVGSETGLPIKVDGEAMLVFPSSKADNPGLRSDGRVDVGNNFAVNAQQFSADHPITSDVNQIAPVVMGAMLGGAGLMGQLGGAGAATAGGGALSQAELAALVEAGVQGTAGAGLEAAAALGGGLTPAQVAGINAGGMLNMTGGVVNAGSSVANVFGNTPVTPTAPTASVAQPAPVTQAPIATTAPVSPVTPAAPVSAGFGGTGMEAGSLINQGMSGLTAADAAATAQSLGVGAIPSAPAATGGFGGLGALSPLGGAPGAGGGLSTLNTITAGGATPWGLTTSGLGEMAGVGGAVGSAVGPIAQSAGLGSAATGAGALGGLGSLLGGLGSLLTGGNGSSTPSNILPGLIQGGLGYLASDSMADAYRDISNQTRADRLPALNAYNAALQNPDTFYSSAPAMGATDAVLRRLSVQGNPAMNPGLLSQAAAYNLGGYNDYLRGLAGAAFGTADTEARAAGLGANASGGGWEAIGAGLGTMFNQQPNFSQLLSQLGGNLGLNIGGMRL